MKHVLLLFLSVFSLNLLAQVQFYGPTTPSTGGVTAQDFETAYDQYDAQGADDFIVPSGVTWYIDSILIPGSYSATATTTCGLIYNIHTDNGGEPSSTIVFGDTINSNLDGNGDGDLVVRFETPVSLTSGHYWLVANGRKNFASGGGQWYWQRDVSLTGYPALWRNPGNGFGSSCLSWTTFYDCTALGMSDSGLAFSIYGCYGPIKPLGFGFDTLLCAGAFNSVTLTGDTIGSQANVTYLWSTGATTQSITVTGSGTFTLTATDSVTQCGRNAVYNVGIGSVPQPDLDDDTICGSSTIPKTWGPIGGCANCVTIWGDGSTGSFFSSSTDGWVSVTILDTSNGCSSSDSAYLTVIPATATIQPGALIDLCSGTTMTVSTLESLTNPSWTFSADGLNWSSIGTNATADITSGGRVAVMGTNSFGCTVFDTSDVILRPSPDPDISFQSQANGSVKLTADAGFATYLWSDGSVGQVINVNQNGIYTVTVTDEFGCEGSSFINVYTVGTQDVIVEQMDIYPNPAQDQLNIVWPESWVGSARAALYDMQGRELTSINASQPMQTLALDGIAAGHYILQVQSPEGVGKMAVVVTK
jgi:hypothetical protein